MMIINVYTFVQENNFSIPAMDGADEGMHAEYDIDYK